ncbi:MAG TPA: phage major capsid protein [Burkholderiaceae bacterium]|nr:phage major capsid protein [Burkholderiaceae bacterium]
MNRAYCTLQIKASEAGGRRTFRGIASSVSTDRMGDVIESEGADYKLPIPFLWQHDSKQPIGWITRAKTSKQQIEVEGEVHDEPTPGKLKDRLDEAWQTMKAGLVRGLSIGFNPLESAEIKGTWGMHYTKWSWLELSAVTIPANADASLTAIKSIDAALLAASGHQAVGVRRDALLPGAAGNRKGNAMQTLQEVREVRAAKANRMKELIELMKQPDYQTSDEESQEFDSLTDEVKTLDVDIRVKQFEAMQAAAATPVRGKSADEGRSSRGGIAFVRKADPEPRYKGEAYTRVLIAKALGMMHGEAPAMIAEKRWGRTHPQLVQFIRAAVAGGGTGSGEWGAELAAADTRYTGDFIEYLYSKTVFDQLPLREIPARVHVKGADGTFIGYWTGESKAIAMSKADYSDVELSPLKVAALTVISMELLEDSQPSAETLIRDGLAEASAQRIDLTFLSATAATPGVSPAGIKYNVSPISPTGTDLAALRNDLQALMAPFVTNKMASGIQLVMNPASGLAIGMMYGALDQLAYPGINENGGTLGSRSVIVGDNVTAGDIIAIRSQDVWKIGDSGIRVSMSKEATIEQSDAPTGATDTPVAQSAYPTNMFQEESVAFKVTRRINWQKRRSTAVQWIPGADYGGVTS